MKSRSLLIGVLMASATALPTTVVAAEPTDVGFEPTAQDEPVAEFVAAEPPPDFGFQEPARDKPVAEEGKKFTFSGYLRMGSGINLRGGRQVCFRLPGADTRFRLGNECDYLVEPNFNFKVASYQGSNWHVHVTPAVFRAWGETEFVRRQQNTDDTSGSLVDTDSLVTRFEQAYAYGTKIEPLGGGTVWAGRRFYNRLQLGINDQFLENNDGDGAGIEDIKLGIGSLSVAFMQNSRRFPNRRRLVANNNRYELPIRLTGIKTVRNGDLSVYLTHSGRLKSSDHSTSPAIDPESNVHSGFALGLYQTLKGTVFGGNTLLGFRYDKDHVIDFGPVPRISTTDFQQVVPTKNTRFVVQQSGSLNKGTVYSLIAQYRIKSRRKMNDTGFVTDGGFLSDGKWFSLGARTDTHISGPFRLLAEIGHERVKPGDFETNGSTRGPERRRTLSMTKFTLAGAVSAGKDSWSRPTLRVFVTHAIWNDATRDVLGEGFVDSATLKQVFGDKKSGTSVGVQAEAWW